MSSHYPEPPTDIYCCLSTTRGLECTCPPPLPADEDEHIADWEQRVSSGELEDNLHASGYLVGFDPRDFYTQFERLASGE